MSRPAPAKPARLLYSKIPARLRNRLLAARHAEPLEFEQLVVRYLVGVFTTSCAVISWYVGTLTPGEVEALAIFIPIAWAIAGVFMLHFALWPARRIERRCATITFDAVTLSLFIHFGGEAASIFFPVYLWVILGNGFRFGIVYMYASMAVNTGFFVLTALYTPDLRADWAFAAGLVLLLVLIPLYVSRLIRDLRSAMASAETANRAKSDFLATMSHELRTPLNAIIGLSQVLDRTAESAQDRMSAMSINSAAARLLEMVNAILDFQRIESQAVTVRSEPVDMAHLMHDAESLLRPLAQQKGLSLSFRFATPLPARVAGDRDHLKTVLLNLAGNAIKYTEQGHVAIIASYLGEAESGAVRIEVHDTGKGIPKAEQPRMFDRFAQAADSERGSEGGVGLGLALCRSLIELMGGEIGLTSALGTGSMFWFEVPAEALDEAAQAGEPAPQAGAEIALLLHANECARIAPALEATGHGAIPDIRNARDFVKARAASGDLWRYVLVVDETELDARALSDIRHALRDAPIPPALVVSTDDSSLGQAANACLNGTAADPALIATVARWHAPKPGEPASERHSTAAAAPQTILVADDNPFNREVAKKLLSLDGHRVVLAANGEEALDTLLRGAVDLAFLDINMPLGNGIEVCKDYQLTIGPQAHIPVIAMTADTSRTTRENCRRAGMAAVLHKPVQLDELRETVRAHAPQAPRKAAAISISTPAARQPEADQAPRLDTRRLDELHRLFGEAAFRDDLLGLFETDFQRHLDGLKQALKDGATARAGDTLHALKSCANTIGASRLAAMCDHQREGHAPLDSQAPTRIASEYAAVRSALYERLGTGGRADQAAAEPGELSGSARLQP